MASAACENEQPEIEVITTDRTAANTKDMCADMYGRKTVRCI